MWTIQHYIAFNAILHADIADTRFLVKSAVDPKYCLLLVDLFTSKVYIYPMKSRNLLAKKLKLFYEDVKNKRIGRMRLQTNSEFKQNQILKLNDEFNANMFHTRLLGGKAFAVEQKIRVIKIFDFMRLRKIGMNQLRNEKYNEKIDRRKRKLRSPLNLDEKVLVLAERLKKKDAHGSLYKASTENIPFFNRDRILTIYKRVELENGVHLYWIEENRTKINGRF